MAYETEVQNGTIGYFNLGGGPHIFRAKDIEVHARDASGNLSTGLNTEVYDCP